MPIRYADSGPALFSGRCAPEEADALLQWLRETPDPSADLAACDDLHTALLQLLLAARVRIAAPPPDPWLAGVLADAAARMSTVRPHPQGQP